MALLQAFAQRGAQVFHFFFVHRQIGMAGDAELRKLGHGAPRKQVSQVRANQARNGDKVRLFGALDGRHAEKARQDARHFDDGDFVFAAKGVFAGEAHDEIERLVGHLWKRMRRVQAHRHQQRLHFAGKKVFHPAALARVALAVGHQFDAFFLQQRQQLVVVNGVLLGHQRMHLGRHFVVRVHGVGAALLIGFAGRQVRRHAHLKKFVQIAGDDGEVAQALQQGHVSAARPVHDPFVEGQDAVVAIQKMQAVVLAVGAHGSRQTARWLPVPPTGNAGASI